MQKQIIILILFLAYFAYSATLGYAPLTLYYTTDVRNYHVYQKRPAIPVITKMNREYPDMRLFEQYYDEYRAWWTIDVIGRRSWEDSWEEYTAIYLDNTAINLWIYLKSKDRTHIMVHPHCHIKLPISDPMWREIFAEEYDLEYMGHRVWRLREEGQ